jgi:hypothetical protein
MKKNIGLAVILPIIFSAFGLFYTSKAAGIVMIIINIFLGILGIILLNTGYIQSLILFQLFLCPFTIFWSVYIAKKKNEFVERNLIITSDLEFNVSGDAFMQTFLVLFFTCGITAFWSQLNEINFLSRNIYMFILLEIVLTVVIANLPYTQNKENIIVKKI